MEIAPIIVNIVIAISVMFLSYLYKKYYPKKINGNMGYRTRRSMISEKNWLLANGYYSRLVFNYTRLLPVVQVVLYMVFGPYIALAGFLALWIVVLFWGIYKTERVLKREGG
ncbi:hypothetical protein FKX85_02695 [Echinicola soli]|uniref:SdpI family protein n=1 Tax=Echinicola soli TaxID=2591634 RepID=A0A514CDU3_9BACT|nr:SdpI family protein [Echinicola soli]QDH78001.1 hypothetical protein FKX85_02695 [Echinicola soli]